MNIFDHFNPNACDISGIKESKSWTWKEYFIQKEKNPDNIILVDMISNPVKGSTPISNEIFEKSKKGTIFVLYCHSGASSGMLQKKLTHIFPEYSFINLAGGISSYPLSSAQII
jgi:rhodanese-related sulfurtransferase